MKVKAKKKLLELEYKAVEGGGCEGAIHKLAEWGLGPPKG
jgi:hypothetical protein